MSQLIAVLMLLTVIFSLYFSFRPKAMRQRLKAAFLGIVVFAGLVGTAYLLSLNVAGLISFLATFVIFASIYALLSLGLNVHWGYTGLFNIGVAGFFGVGAYTSAILVKISADPQRAAALNEVATYLGLPFIVGLLGAMITSALLALVIGVATLRLRTDYLAIATLGISETIRLVASNERWLTEGVRGISGIPAPFRDWWETTLMFSGRYYVWFYVLIVLFVLVIAFILLEKIIASPWGRVLKAIREDEDATGALGKNVFAFKLQSLVIGAVIMGAGGSLYAHFAVFISPNVVDPVSWTFLVWLMLIIGGTGNNLGAIFGAFLIWGIWSGTNFLGDMLPSIASTPWGNINVDAQIFGPLRVIIIASIFITILLFRQRGIFDAKKPQYAKDVEK